MSQDIEGRPVKHAKRRGKDGEAAKKQKKPRPLLESAPRASAPAIADNGQCKFARVLGSPDYQTREQGLQALTRWLTQKSSISELDMLKIWKGLFFCFWHSDKVPVQTDLAERLAAILPRMHRDTGLLYMRTFVATLRREWFTIDRHRLDKFMLLVRKFIGQMLSTIAASRWDTTLTQDYATLLQGGLLLPADIQRSASLTYHVTDLFMDALRATATATAPPPRDALLALLLPFAAALQHGGEPVLLSRVKENVFAELAREAVSPSEGAPLAALPVLELSELLFDMGAQEGIKARNREALYGASQSLQRSAGKRRKLGGSEEAAAALGGQQQGQQRMNGVVSAGQQGAAGAADGAAVSDRKGKKKKRALQAAEAETAVANEPVSMDAEQCGVPAGAEALASKKLKRRKQQAPEAEAVSIAASAPAGNGRAATPELPGAKKRKKKAKGDAAAVDAVVDASAQHIQQVHTAEDAAEPMDMQQQQQNAKTPGTNSKKQRAAAEAAVAALQQQGAVTPSSGSKKQRASAVDAAATQQQQQQGDVTPATSGKKKRKSVPNGDVANGDGPAASMDTPKGAPVTANSTPAAEARDVVANGSDQQATPASHKKKNKHQGAGNAAAGPAVTPASGGGFAEAVAAEAAAAMQTLQQQQQQQQSGTPGPSTGKRSRTQQQADGEASTPARAQQAPAVQGTPSTPAGPALKSTGIPLTTPQTATTPSTGKAAASAQQQQQQAHASAGSPLPPGARSAPAKGSKASGNAKTAAAAARGAATAVKKGVRFDEKSNLVFQVGGPVPLPDIRTPPPAKPKGSALKQQQHQPHGRPRGIPKAPGSAPAKVAASGLSLGNVNGQGRQQQQQQQQRRLVTPKSAPRPRAASFF